MIIRKFAYSTQSGNLSDFYHAVQQLNCLIREEPGISFVGPMPDPFDPARLMSMLMYDSAKEEQRLTAKAGHLQLLERLAG